MKFSLENILPQFNEASEAERRASHIVFLKRLSRLSGFLPLISSPTVASRVVNFFYYVVIDLFLLHIAVLCACDIYMGWDGDYIRVAYTLVNTVTYLCLVSMEIYYQAWSYRLVHILEFTQTNFIATSENGVKERRARQLCTVLCIITVFGIIQWVLDPLMHTVLRGRELQLPLQLWYPIDVQPLRQAVLLFVMQAIAQCYFVTIVCSIACLNITFTLLACGQYDALCGRVRNSWYEGLLRAGVAPSTIDMIDLEPDRLLQLQSLSDYEVKNDSSGSVRVIHIVEGSIDFRPYEDHIRASIRACVEHHLIIKEFCMHFRTYFDYPLTLEIGSLVVVITTALYAAVENFEFKTFQYVFVGLLHLFAFCYCGTTLYNESTRPADAAWEACWWSGTRRATKELQMVMVHAARPLQLTAGPFFNLNFANFISALKMCWSVYTLLTNLKEK